MENQGFSRIIGSIREKLPGMTDLLMVDLPVVPLPIRASLRGQNRTPKTQEYGPAPVAEYLLVLESTHQTTGGKKDPPIGARRSITLVIDDCLGSLLQETSTEHNVA